MSIASAGDVMTGVITLLRAQLGDEKVGDSALPVTDPLLPYCIVDRTYSTSFGSLSYPNRDMTVEFNIRCVGDNRQSADWMVDQVSAVLAGRGSDGKFTYDVSVVGHDVWWRSVEDAGTPIEVDGLTTTTLRTVVQAGVS